MQISPVLRLSFVAVALAACGGSSSSQQPQSAGGAPSPSAYSGSGGESLAPEQSASDDDVAAAQEGDGGDGIAPAEGEGSEAEAAGTGGTGAASSRYDDMPIEELAEVLLAFMEQMAEIIDTNKDDCDAMADALQALFEENAELVAEMQRRKDDPETQEYMKENSSERMQEIAMKMMGGIMGCADNPRMKEVMEAL